MLALLGSLPSPSLGTMPRPFILPQFLSLLSGARDAVTNSRRPQEMLHTPRQESEPYTVLGIPLEGQMVQQSLERGLIAQNHPPVSG